MEKIKIKTCIKALGAPRPRFARRGRHVQTYMPESYRKYQVELKKEIIKGIEICKGMSELNNLNYKTFFENKVSVNILIYYRMPKSWSNKKAEEMIYTPHLQKPDIDNVSKGILDAMTGILYNDDSQVYNLSVRKKWGILDEVKIEIGEM